MSSEIQLKHSIKLLNRIFPYTRNIANLKIDSDSLNYISYKYNATDITNIIINAIDNIEELKLKDITITDATAGVGGNTISFSKKMYKINSIELDKTRYECLLNNINIYNLNNVTTFNGDYLDFLDNLTQDIVFLDPPWGGKSYKSIENIKLSLGDTSIEEICNMLHDKTKLICLKLPLNYDLDYFNNNINNFEIKINTLQKMLIIILISL